MRDLIMSGDGQKNVQHFDLRGVDMSKQEITATGNDITIQQQRDGTQQMKKVTVPVFSAEQDKASRELEALKSALKEALREDRDLLEKCETRVARIEEQLSKAEAERDKELAQDTWAGLANTLNSKLSDPNSGLSRAFQAAKSAFYILFGISLGS